MPALRLPSLAPDLPAGRARRIGVGLLVFLVATLLRMSVDPILHDKAPFLMHVVAVGAATWLGGLEGGLVAVVLGALAVDYLFVEPRYGLKAADTEHAAALVLFGAVSLGLVWQLSRWRRAEQALRISEQRLRRLVDVSAQIVWVAQPDGRVTQDSPSWRAFTGRTYEQWTGWNWLDVIHPDDRERVAREWRQALQTQARYHPEFRMLHHTGAYRHVACSAVPILDTHGTVREWIGMNVDITERKQAEQTLRESREDLSHAQSLAKAGSWRLDLARNQLRWSEETHRIFGVPVGTPVPYERFLAAVHPDDRQLVEGAWQAALEGEPYALDHRIVVNGEVRWVHERAELEFDAAGTFRAGVGSVQDITDRRRLEEELRAQTERLLVQANVIEHAHDAILILDDHERITFWNAGAERLYGVVAGEAMGHDAHRLLGTAVDAVAEMQAALAATGTWQGELRHRRNDGTAVMIESRQVRVTTAGQPGVTLEINRDITDRIRAEEERQATMARMRLLLEMSEALSAAATPEQISALALKTAVPALGALAGNVGLLSADGREIEIIGTWESRESRRGCPSRFPLMPPTPIGDAIREGVTVTVASRADGMARYPELPECLGGPGEALAAIPLRGEQIVGALGLSFVDAAALEQRDRSFAVLVARQTAQALERARLLTSERRAHAEAQEAGRVKDEFLATLSHELRTPLNAILGWAQLLSNGQLKAEAQRHAVEVIERSAKVQTRLVEEVLDLSRIVTGRLRLDLQPVDLATIIEAAAETVRPGAEAKGIELQLDLSPVPLVGDASRLQQVIWNLLANGVKFAGQGGSVRVAAHARSGGIEIVVSDTGEGIPPAFLPHVFERFTQADGSRTRRHGGLGLGLAIVRHIVELHGGTVTAASPGEGQGATFTVNLPLREASVTTSAPR